MPFHSSGATTPIVHVAGGLHADGWPPRSQTLTFQKTRRDDDSAAPAYGMWAVSSDSLRPLSHRSPRSAARPSAVDATMTCHAVWRSPRSRLSTCQERRGFGMSMPSGSFAYSHRSRAGLSRPSGGAFAASGTVRSDVASRMTRTVIV